MGKTRARQHRLKLFSCNIIKQIFLDLKFIFIRSHFQCSTDGLFNIFRRFENLQELLCIYIAYYSFPKPKIQNWGLGCV